MSQLSTASPDFLQIAIRSTAQAVLTRELVFFGCQLDRLIADYQGRLGD